MKEHFNWKPEYDSEDHIQVDENYDGFIASYQPEGIDHIWDTMVENMDFAEYCGLCMKRPVGAHKIEDSQFHLHQKGFHVPYKEAQEKYNVAETYLNVCNVKYTNFLFMCLDAYTKNLAYLRILILFHWVSSYRKLGRVKDFIPGTVSRQINSISKEFSVS